MGVTDKSGSQALGLGYSKNKRGAHTHSPSLLYVTSVYVTMLPVLQSIWLQEIRSLLNNEIGKDVKGNGRGLF
jgi:hypothetical protein